MKTMALIIIAAALAALGVWYGFFSGSSGSGGHFGQPLQGAAVTVAQLRENPAAYLGQVVLIEGTLTKECPSAGCWWYVKDPSGEIRADSLGSGFALPLKQEGHSIRMAGKVIQNEGGEVELAAIGAELE